MKKLFIIALCLLLTLITGCSKEKEIEMGNLTEPDYKTVDPVSTDSGKYNRSSISFKENKDCSVLYSDFNKATIKSNYGTINYYLDYNIPGSDPTYEYNSFCTYYVKKDQNFQVTFIESNTEYDNTDTIHFKFVTGSSSEEICAISICNNEYSITVYSDQVKTFGLLYEFSKLLEIDKTANIPDANIDYINHSPDEDIDLGFNIPDWNVSYKGDSGIFIVNDSSNALNNMGIAISSKYLLEEANESPSSTLPYSISINYLDIYSRIYGYDLYFSSGIRKSGDTLIRTYSSDDFSVTMEEEIPDLKTKLVNEKYTVTSTHNTLEYTWGSEYGYSLFADIGGKCNVDTFYITTSSENYYATFFYVDHQVEYVKEIENMFISSLY